MQHHILKDGHKIHENSAFLHELGGIVEKYVGNDNRLDSDIPGVKLHKWDHKTTPASYLMPPSICLIAQGVKRVYLGDESYLYDASNFLLTSVNLPVIAQIEEASKSSPYLGISLELDQNAIRQMMMQDNLPEHTAQRESRGMAVSPVTADLLDAFTRLLRLLDKPQDIPMLAPLIHREIGYRLLTGPQGARIREIISSDSHSHQIAKAIDWLKENFNETVRVETLAQRSGMSPSNFHHHFREVTAMSPIQFQKQLRLNEARRLMLTDQLDASSAAFQVGYESPSQFSREYRRLFGIPPKQDISQLMNA